MKSEAPRTSLEQKQTHGKSERFFVVTGGPGSGKSALIEGLQRSGFARSVEAGRGVIQDQVAIAGAAHCPGLIPLYLQR